ncbi:hypothetical protein F2P79_018092 [Pimephales promelas]|nr:hypothetical protein F2P79_018092 [Pimephales promelas]
MACCVPRSFSADALQRIEVELIFISKALLMNHMINHIKKRHPGIGGTEIKVCMAQKLKDLRRRAERMPAAEDTKD